MIVDQGGGRKKRGPEDESLTHSLTLSLYPLPRRTTIHKPKMQQVHCAPCAEQRGKENKRNLPGAWAEHLLSHFFTPTLQVNLKLIITADQWTQWLSEPVRKRIRAQWPVVNILLLCATHRSFVTVHPSLLCVAILLLTGVSWTQCKWRWIEKKKGKKEENKMQACMWSVFLAHDWRRCVSCASTVFSFPWDNCSTAGVGESSR